MKILLFTSLLTIFICQNGFADLVISTEGVATTVTFDSTLAGSNNGQFAGLGLNAGATTTGVLDSNSWSILGINTNHLAEGVSTGGVGPGGLYAFDRGSSNHLLGVQPNGGVFTPGSITLKIANGTGMAITDFKIEYDIWTFNDQSGSSSLDFSFSTNGTDFTSVSELDFSTVAVSEASPSWQSDHRSRTISQDLASGSNLYLRWSGNDVILGDGRDEYGVDDISITLNPTAVPEPSSMLVFGLVAMGFGIRRRRK